MIELIEGDCLEVTKGMDKKFDLILCDPPYGTTRCKWDSIIPLDDMWSMIEGLSNEKTAIVICASQPFTSYLIMSNARMFKYDWIWEKDKGANWMFANKMPFKVSESLCVFYKKQPTYNPQKTINPNGMSKRHHYKNPSKINKNVKQVMGEGWKETRTEKENYHGKNYEPEKLLPRNIQRFKRDQPAIHPTQKPVALMEYIIKTYTYEGDSVLDFAMGSGTTGVACVNTGRNFVGIEKDSGYFKIANDRIQKAKDSKA